MFGGGGREEEMYRDSRHFFKLIGARMGKGKNKKRRENSPSPEVFTVEKILKSRTCPDGTVEYFLKWHNYPDSENTWEPEDNLNCPDLIEEFKKRKGSTASTRAMRTDSPPAPPPKKKMKTSSSDEKDKVWRFCEDTS